MKWADRVTALVLLVIAGMWIYLALQVPFPIFARVSRLAPGHYPMGVAVLLAVLAFILLVQSFHGGGRVEKEGSEEEAGRRNPKAVQHLLTGFALFLGYVILVPLFGFILVSPLFVFLFVSLIGRYTLPITIAIAMSIPALLWIIFAWWLAVPVPKGPWGF